jgi:putative transposase
MTDTIGSMATQIDQQQLARELVDRARAEGVELVGPGGMLTGLTKSVLETALEEEMSEHLGYDKHDPVGGNGGNSRVRASTTPLHRTPRRCGTPGDRSRTRPGASGRR